MSRRVAVVGGGILGLSVAARLAGRGDQVTVFEKETRLATHQTGRNSQVVHSGLYYAPGSLKAQLCVRGARSMMRFAADHDIAHARCGKLVVATTPLEVERLATLEARGAANGVEVHRLDARGARTIEPAVAALAALHVPSTGIVDYGAVCVALAAQIERTGGRIELGAPVTSVEQSGSGWSLRAGAAAHEVDGVVVCAGLHADRFARACGIDPGVRIIPFRGEYHTLTGPVAERVATLVYPVPDPSLPFLGVHVTRGIDGTVHAGPNAVLAGSIEGYRWRDVSPRDLARMATWPGLWRVGRRHWRTGLGELLRSGSRRRFARDVARLTPGVRASHLAPARSGVRAQAVDASGRLVDDFVIVSRPGQVHVVNAPSPAATSALELAATIVDRLDAES